MVDESVVVLGLPASGKTTYLAALRYSLTSLKVQSKYTLVKLLAGNGEYLTSIAARWASAQRQERTQQESGRTVSISLRGQGRPDFTLSFPDLAGETFARMWENREISPSAVDLVKAKGVLLFIHSDTIRHPGWIADDEEAGMPPEGDAPRPWAPRSSPTQVQLIDLLRCLNEAPLAVGPRQVAVILSAWDTMEEEGITPEDFLEVNLPMLHQYIHHGLAEGWSFRVYGVSAQGADYGDDASAQRMLELDVPADRIRVIGDGNSSNDLTEPLHWLLT